MPYYSDNTENPYGFGGSLGSGAGKHTNSRVDKFTATKWNNLEHILTEMRTDVQTDRTDIANINSSVLSQVFLPYYPQSGGENVVRVLFKGIGYFTPTSNLDGEVYPPFDGYVKKIIAYRGTPGTSGLTQVDVKVDGTSILPNYITFSSSDTDATVYEDLSNNIFVSHNKLSVDILSNETNAQDLIIIAEIAEPYAADQVMIDFVSYGTVVTTDTWDGYFRLYEDAYLETMLLSSDNLGAGGQYSITLYADGTAYLDLSLTSEGYNGTSVSNAYFPQGTLFTASITEVPTGVPEDLRLQIWFNRKSKQYLKVAEFQAFGYYQVADNVDGQRYFDDQIYAHYAFATRGVAGSDGQTDITLQIDSTHFDSLTVNFDSSAYDSTYGYTSIGRYVHADSYLSMNIDQIEEGNPQDLRVFLVYEDQLPVIPVGLIDSTTHDGAIGRLDSTAAELKDELIRLDATAQEVKALLTKVDATVTSLESTYTTLDATVTEISERLDITAAELGTSYDSTIDELKSAISSNATGISSLDTNKAGKGGAWINDHAVYISSGNLVSSITHKDQLAYISDTTGQVGEGLLALQNAGLSSTPEYDYVDFDNAYGTPTHAPGRLFWDNENKTLALYSDSTEVTLQIGQEGWIRVKNETGGTLVNGRAARVTGVNGSGVPTAGYANAGDSTTAHCIGFFTMDIPNGSYGYVTDFGVVSDIDTAQFSSGDEVYLSDSTNGWYENEPPTSAASSTQELGTIGISHATTGSVLVHPHSPEPNEKRAMERSWAISSLAGGSGEYYFGGFYKHGASNDDFSPSITLGSTNASYAAHVFVVIGEVTVDDVVIKVTGTRIDDAGTRTPSYDATISLPNATAADTYVETSEKFIGQVTLETISGTAKNCNYGFSKYWDNNNTCFTITGLEVTGLAGGNDTGPDFKLIHHKNTGWTYNAGSTATPPYLVSMADDHSTESQLVNGEEFAWKRTDLDTLVTGCSSEGALFLVTTTANNAVETGTAMIRVINHPA